MRGKVWRIEFAPRAVKEWKKLDSSVQSRFRQFLKDLKGVEDPYWRGKVLTGNWAGYWSYRVGDYRLIAGIDVGEMVIVMIAMGHRSQVYAD
ncbi:MULTISPECIES: type II toxin-antitoxin system RelE/ParE family toxin [unclassified Corynebacterium]|uniref:type II toxin-antitoxin system RelE family toxin n=1 Tax=unclassified Corynebacterium TaxID=2624378 RepID=UPI0029CA5B9F|nr:MULTISPECIES: type II toxin-antitoxin system RelE/ParE family toxin [unclassified Corynebacterium]WPF65972.1 type II toxin-antitoxin system RelE/ParE family toxin [Corynebacterium sp. 22KM0430]WPF68465.1 type II toxin-antitoxin system RelE/ParE family toxin [Corynebacterium sp. 21KM1197]